MKPVADRRFKAIHQTADLDQRQFREDGRNREHRTDHGHSFRDARERQMQRMKQIRHLSPRVAPRGKCLGHQVIELVVHLPERAADEIRHDEHTRGDPLALQDWETPARRRRDSRRRTSRRPPASRTPPPVRCSPISSRLTNSELTADAVEMPLEHRRLTSMLGISVWARRRSSRRRGGSRAQRPIGVARQHRGETVVARARDRRREHRLQAPAPPDRGSRLRLVSRRTPRDSSWRVSGPSRRRAATTP